MKRLLALGLAPAERRRPRSQRRARSSAPCSSTGRARTLYLFEKDKGPTSTCYGACASAWPPLPAGAQGARATGVPAAKLAATKRTDGKAEVTYGGHPLYTYAGDAKPGDVQGQGLDQFGAEWYAVAPNGRKIDEGD
jgi:predicted lipoprotein with Yx(FWY)xxD motif